jgi:Ca2+/H+ antiporter, TMEM165/GDT1 family
MEAFLLTTAAVAIAELGDRTQLLALLLAVKFRRPWPILAGMILAALGIHGISAALGMGLSQFIDQAVLGWIVGLLFIGMGIWVLVPEGVHAGDRPRETGRGAFITALVTFFLMEIGDKTQLASMALAARFEVIIPVVLGAALGMVAVNAPVIWLGHRFADRIPLDKVRILAAVIFIAIGLWILWDTVASGAY